MNKLLNVSKKIIKYFFYVTSTTFLIISHLISFYAFFNKLFLRGYFLINLIDSTF